MQVQKRMLTRKNKLAMISLGRFPIIHPLHLKQTAPLMTLFKKSCEINCIVIKEKSAYLQKNY